MFHNNNRTIYFFIILRDVFQAIFSENTFVFKDLCNLNLSQTILDFNN